MKPTGILFLLLLAAALAILPGCASTGPPSQAAPTPTVQPVTTVPSMSMTTMATMTPAPATGTMMPPETTMMPPTTGTQPVATTPVGGGNTVEITLTAQNIGFDRSTITVPAGSPVVMTFVNNDFGVPHNFGLYTDSHATTRVFNGDFVTGVQTVTYHFTAPSTPGTYFFRCDVHPDTMTGDFIVT